MRNKTFIKMTVILFVVMTSIVFIYSLGFFTNFLPIRSAYKDLYMKLQNFNRGVFNLALGGFISVVLLLFLDNHKTNQYKGINQLVGIGAGVYALYQAYFVLSRLEGLKSEYMIIEPEKVRLLYPDYMVSDTIFSFGHIIFSVFAIAAVLIILISLMNKAKKMTSREG